ncbi:MAG: putative baseplate assembly protein [Minicystis sp.]
MPGTDQGLAATYYSNADFSGRRIRRVDATVDFNWGTGSPHPSIGGDTFSVRWMAWISPATTGSYTFYTEADDGVRLWVDGELVIDFWKDTSAVSKESAPIYLSKGRRYAIRLEYYENGGAASVKLLWSGPNVPKAVIPSSVLTPLDVDTIHLDGRFPSVTTGSWVVVATPDYEELYLVSDAAEDARMGFTLSAKTTRLKLEGENLREEFNDQVRRITAYVQSEELAIALKPRTDPVVGPTVLLDRLIDDPGAGRRMIIAGTDTTGAPAAEIVTLASATRAGDLTQLTFASIKGQYRRDAVAIFGNVASATHGETVPDEVLGSGDAGQGYQQFKLRQAPLTYVSADVPSGGATTLDVRVDDVRWHEVPTLLGRGPKERVYVTQADDAGKITVQFGDGRAGARLPTGRENVIARYRKGIGREGLVAAGQLSLLITRPLGVRSVVNPLAPTGAADPQSVADTQQNAPLSVLTLDRIVSLKDYEDFARSYAGIAKAHAAWTWNGDARGVLLTVAGEGGAAVLANTKLYDGLHGAIAGAGDPSVPFDIKTYASTTFTVNGGIGIETDYDGEKVLAAVVAALREAFSFTPRAFGAGVFASEVIAVIQRVPGVRMVDLDALVRVTGGAHKLDRADFLEASAPVGGELSDTVAPAELLTLTTAPLTGLQVIA